MIIAIDVDGVLALETPFKWGLKTFKNFTERFDEFSRYENFSEAIQNDNNLIIQKERAFEWWKNSKLYDNLELNPLIKNLIENLRDDYPTAKWMVLSDCFEEHINSKIEFCKRVLPVEFEFYNTKDKFQYKADIYIDDKPLNLIECKRQWEDECYTILVRHFYNSLNYEELEYIDKIFKVEKEIDLSYL